MNSETKEEIWLRPMPNAPKPTEKSNKTLWQHTNATKTFDYTPTSDGQLGNDSHPTGVVNPVYENPNLHTKLAPLVLNSFKTVSHDATSFKGLVAEKF